MYFSNNSNLPENWERKSIGQICSKFTSGGTPSRRKNHFYEDGTIPWIKSKELNDGVISNSEELITEEALANSSAKLLPENTVLMAMYGATVGKLGVTSFKAACNQACAAMVVNEKYSDFKFLFYLLKNWRTQIIAQASGAAQQNLSGELIRSFEFDFPPVEIQRIIGEQLWTIDEKIRINQQISKTLEEIAQTIFKSWFVDFDPVHAKSRGEQPVGMDEETAALFPDSFEESELGLIPAGWKIFSVGDLLEPKKGKTITKATAREGNIPVVAGGLEPAYFHDTSNVEPPVITVSASGANAGYVRLYTEPIWASDCTYISKQQSDTVLFWLQFFKLNQSRIYEMQQGGAQPHIYASDLKRLKICLPIERELIEIFEKTIEPIFELIGNSLASNSTLSEVRDALLPRLISGELELSDDLIHS